MSENEIESAEDSESESISDPRFYVILNAAFSDREAALKLIEADPSIVEARNSIGETALHYLVVENELESVEFLSEHGSDVNTMNAFDESAIMEAAQLGYFEMVDLLLRLGAAPNGPDLLERAKPPKRKQFAAILRSHDVSI